MAGAVHTPSPSVVRWLLDSDPSLRWQVLQDLLGASPDEVAAERSRVATHGHGAQLLAMQGADGTWAGAAWNRGWTSTMHVLMLLCEFGLDAESDAARRAVERVRDLVTWKDCGPPECATHPFFLGETEPCINGQVAMVGAWFRQDVRPLIARLLCEQLPDGGWNCDAERGSTHSSFHTTICVLEALLEFERCTGAGAGVTDARLRGQDYLLNRRVFRRSTGEAIEHDRKPGPGPAPNAPAFTSLAFPAWWHYDVLRGLDFLRRAGVTPDTRVDEAVALLLSKRDADGRWPLEVIYPGAMPIALGEAVGHPSRWNTLRALRVLKWSEGDR